MNFSNATNEQLWTILSDDWEIPEQHVRPLVEEALNRKLFNGIIGHLARKLFGVLSNEYRKNYEDLYSIGYIGILKAIDKYETGKIPFKYFAFMRIKSALQGYRDELNTEMRKHYKTMLSLDSPDFSTTDQNETLINTIVDYSRDVEEIVVQKITWEERFINLAEREKEILIYFSQGYSLNEISKRLGYAGHGTVQKRFQRAIKKINPNANFNLKSSGLELKTKRRSS